MIRRYLFTGFWFFSAICFAGDVPEGLVRTGDILPSDTYEMVLSPSYMLSPDGAYLSSEVRYQPNDDFGVGFGFGAGEIGFNFGVNGSWYILPDIAGQPALAIIGGLYFNRLDQANYFVFNVTPVVSKMVSVSWGKITPYAGLHLAPSFGLGAGNEFSMRTSMGAEFNIQALDAVRLWTEFGISLVNGVNEIVLGVSYPFSAL